jgi:hypothetical protein
VLERPVSSAGDGLAVRLELGLGRMVRRGSEAAVAIAVAASGGRPNDAGEDEKDQDEETEGSNAAEVIHDVRFMDGLRTKGKRTTSSPQTEGH